MRDRIESIFVDTNILLYAHDTEAGEKHQIAKKKICELWENGLSPSTSLQVLQEFSVNLLRKNVPVQDVGLLTEIYLHWEIIVPNIQLMFLGLELLERFSVSFWDSMILAAAKQAKATVIWSEDFNTGQDYGGIKVINPVAFS